MSVRGSISGTGILVTGGAGFIGSHLVDRLIAEGAREVVVIDNMFTGSESNISEALASGKVSFYRDDADIATSLEYICSKHEIDIVFNCATKALNYSYQNPSNAFSTNVVTVLNLLELQRRGKFRTLCHFSTSEVYGTAVYEPMDEVHPRNPTTTYAAGKAAADLAVESYVRMFDVDAYIIRPFNNYGPRQNHDGPLAGIIPVTARRILTGGAPEIHGTGNQSRDFIFVLDTVDATIKLYDTLPRGETVNVSTNNQVTVSDLIGRIAEALGYGGPIVRKPARYSDVECHNASNAKVRELIDYTLTPFPSGLELTLNHYRRIFGATP